MFSAARQEASVISAELATTARTGIVEVGGIAARAGEMEVVNPMAVRQMAEASVKEGLAGGECNCLFGIYQKYCLYQPPLKWGDRREVWPD